MCVCVFKMRVKIQRLLYSWKDVSKCPQTEWGCAGRPRLLWTTPPASPLCQMGFAGTSCTAQSERSSENISVSLLFFKTPLFTGEQSARP